MNDVYALTPDGPTYMKSKALGTLRNREREERFPKAPEFLFEDESPGSPSEADHFELVIAGETLEEILGGTAEEAVDAIESGAYDDALDAIAWVEEQGDARAAVLDTLEARQTVLDRVGDDAGAITAADLSAGGKNGV